jgi:hypothetical protein
MSVHTLATPRGHQQIGSGLIMTKRTKRTKVQPKKRAKVRRGSSAAHGKTRKASKQRAGGTKQTIARAKPKRAGAKKAARKKEQRMKPPTPVVETAVVDVVEEPAPGVITVTEFEETQVTRPGLDETEDDDGA